MKEPKEPNTTCEQCDKAFFMWPSQARSGRRFCSHACAYLKQTKSKEPNSICIVCNKPFYRKTCSIKAGRDWCCSQSCGNISKGIKSAEEKFWKYVQKTDYCWLWTGGKTVGGYGQINGHDGVQYTHIYVHRLSYTMHIGPIPEGMKVLHRCDNPPCVNPDHLFLGTDADNVADKVAKGRHCFGEKHHNAKLTEPDAIEIRRRYTTGEPVVSLADAFGVSPTTIQDIICERTWRYLLP